MFKLVIQDDEGKTTVVPLIRDEITIGRKEGNTIRLTERNVSRRHARIMRNNGEVQIEDLGSYNGIRVNNARIAERVALRVSDQVQIGDYKLYLKAEGEQQVDDGRTMPLERVDGNGEATSSSNAPTQPLGVPASAIANSSTPSAASSAAGLANAQLIGNPNRTQVAIADTDPAGRPVATAAAVAALTQTTGYGKLVVLSSNFAGKEFELSRPQMIVGRTDENDIVVNHRSISRNHAKVTRETDTGRYTISDLQSSNGVRVNGQDYSKVELRRGDVVDLGHVRLRFIEPGEDFLFSRDAVITDVPDAGGGGKRGMIIAVLLGILVLGGVGVFVLKGGSDNKGKGSDNNNVVARDSGAATMENPVVGPGSDQVKVADVTPDAATPAVVNPPVEDVAAKCDKLKSDYKWNELRDCAQNLPDKAAVADLTKLATDEAKAEFTKDDVKKLAAAGKFKEAKTTLAKIGDKSVYRREASDEYDNKIGAAQDELKSKVQTAANDHKCSDVKGFIRDAKSAGVPTSDVDGITCTAAQVATTEPKTTVEPKQPKNPVEPKVTPTQPKNPVETPHEAACDPAAARSKGEDFLNNGMDTAALNQFEASLKCKSDTQVMKMAYIASCRLKNAPKAKAYFAKLGSQGSLVQVCMRFGIDPAQ